MSPSSLWKGERLVERFSDQRMPKLEDLGFSIVAQHPLLERLVSDGQQSMAIEFKGLHPEIEGDVVANDSGGL